MSLYHDAQLDYYADRFVAQRLFQHGITLVQYLADIERRGQHAIEYFERLALTPEPPLPKQRAAILRLWHAQDTGLGVASNRSVCDAALINPHELVAQWRAEAEAAERAVAHLPRRNGAAVEPLHHHRHPRRFGAAYFNKRGA